ncbi:MAG: efflux RND transporter periplasmic adaptor subunit [Verrucomicrobiota bacterium]
MAKSSFPTGWLLLAVLLASGAGGGWYVWGRNGDKPPEVTTVPVTRGPLQQEVKATGALQPVTSVEISSQVSGLVKQVLVDFNDVVKKGQVLARIDEATYVSKLQQAQAQLINTQANHDLTAANTKRTRVLATQQLVTDQELQEAEAQLKQADAQLLIQQAAVDNAKIDLDRCTLLSPIDGVVIDRQTEVGKTVAASLNAPTLFLIVNDLTKMEISAGVSEADIGSVKEGQDVTFLVDAYPGRLFRGTVAQIRNAPVTQSNVVTYGAIIEVDNSDLRLKPGMTANVSIITARRDNVLRLANSTLRVRVPESLLPPAPVAAAPVAAAQTATAASIAPGSEPVAANGDRGGPRGAGGPGGRGGGRGGRGGGRGTGGAGGGETQIVTRTVFKSVGTLEVPRVERLTVRLGITDGVNTEVIDGVNEGDAIVSSVNLPGAPVAAPQAGGNNPFQGRGGGGPGGGGGGGGRGGGG